MRRLRGKAGKDAGSGRVVLIPGAVTGDQNTRTGTTPLLPHCHSQTRHNRPQAWVKTEYFEVTQTMTCPSVLAKTAAIQRVMNGWYPQGFTTIVIVLLLCKKGSGHIQLRDGYVFTETRICECGLEPFGCKTVAVLTENTRASCTTYRTRMYNRL